MRFDRNNTCKVSQDDVIASPHHRSIVILRPQDKKTRLNSLPMRYPITVNGPEIARSAANRDDRGPFDLLLLEFTADVG